MNNLALQGLGYLAELPTEEELNGHPEGLADLGIGPADAANLYKSGKGAAEMGKKILDDPLGTAKTALYAIPVPIPPIPFPIPAGAILDAGEAVFNVGKKAIDFLSGGPQKRKRARRNKKRLKSLQKIFNMTLKDYPEFIYRPPKYPSPKFVKMYKKRVNRPKGWKGGKVPSWAAVITRIYEPKLIATWHAIYRGKPKNRKRDDEGRAMALARQEAKKKPKPKRARIARKPKETRARRAPAKKRIPTKEDWLRLAAAVKKQQAAKKAKKRKRQEKEKKKVRAAAKRKDKKSAKKIRDKSKKLKQKQKERTKKALNLKKRAQKLKKENAALKKRLAAATTAAEETSLKKEVTKKTEEVLKTKQANVLVAAATQNVAAQAAVAKEIAKAIEAGDQPKAAVLTDAYNKLSDLSGKMKDTRKLQLKNWGIKTKASAARKKFVSRAAERRARLRERFEARKAARRAA